MNDEAGKDDMKILFGIAVRSEIYANDAYATLADQIQNFILKEKLRFLALEEDVHRKMLIKMFEETFPGKTLIVPDESGMPKINVEISENNSLSDILTAAMKAEKQSEDSYRKLAGKFTSEEKKELMLYLAEIESGHHYFLDVERSQALRFEDYDSINEMMHVGP